MHKDVVAHNKSAGPGCHKCPFSKIAFLIVVEGFHKFN
jgi:hypothetical protein